MGQFVMPSLGADMEAGTLVEWLVKPGERVKRGDIIAVVETQKGAIEIEVFEDGVFEKSLVEIGTKVPVGTPIAEISQPGEAKVPTETPAAQPSAVEAPKEPELAGAEIAPQPAPPPKPKPQPAAEHVAAPPPPPPPLSTAAEGSRQKVSPAARRLAGQSGVDLAALSGSGPDGAIVLADIEAKTPGEPAKRSPAASAPAPSPPAGAPMADMRAAIAAAMSRSKREIPHYYLEHHVDITDTENWLATKNAGREPSERLIMGTVFVKAVATALKKYPEFNGFFADGAFAPSKSIHTGVAINIRGTGLVAPAIHDADCLDLDGLMVAMRDLVARVRAGRFRGSELSDPTITVSSIGERGVETLYGVIYPPQVAIVGFGTPVTRAWVVDGMIGPRRIVSVTLAGDHRVSDGHRGALFLNAIANLLQEPDGL